MFGYIGPEKGELKIKDWTLYQAYYCGLCKTLGKRYGQLPRLTLSYDCTFIAILLSAFYPCGGCEEHKCAYKPFKRAQPVIKASKCIDFAADLNILLAYFQSRDAWEDERKLRGAAGKIAFSHSAHEARRNRPELYSSISEGIGRLSLLEQQGCAELDLPADAFGALMRDCIKDAPIPENQSKAVSALFYHLGKWVYLIDAWEDRPKDRQSGAYNPFLAAKANAQRASFLLHASLNEAIKAYSLLDVVSAKGILDNIFYEGCVNRTEKLLKAGGENEQ